MMIFKTKNIISKQKIDIYPFCQQNMCTQLNFGGGIVGKFQHNIVVSYVGGTLQYKKTFDMPILFLFQMRKNWAGGPVNQVI